MIKRFRKVSDKLYRGGCPSAEGLCDLKEKYNIERIVSLDAKSGKRISTGCKMLGIEQIILPIEGTRVSLINFLTHNIKDLLGSKNTFVHCSAGKDRTGLACALFKIKSGLSPKKAFQEACDLGFGINLDPVSAKLYRECIINAKVDENDADIVSNQRDRVGEDSVLQDVDRHTWGPLDATRTDPDDKVYQDYNNQRPTRQNYDEPIILHHEEETPTVGLYNNDSTMIGVGPTQNAGGFIYEE